MPNIELSQGPISNNTANAAPSTDELAKAIADFHTVEAKLGLVDALDGEERKRLYRGAYRMPNATIEAVATIASRHGGVVAGVIVSPDELRAALLLEQAVEPLATASERVARRARDVVLRKRYDAVIKTEAALAALKRLGQLDGHALNSDLTMVKATTPRRRAAKKTEAPVVKPT